MIPFDRAFAQRSAESFIDDVLVGSLGVSRLSVGENFRSSAAVARATPRCWLGTRASARGWSRWSTSVVAWSAPPRSGDLVRAGDVGGAARLLGAPFEIDVEPVQSIASASDDGYLDLALPSGLALPGGRALRLPRNPAGRRCPADHRGDRNAPPPAMRRVRPGSTAAYRIAFLHPLEAEVLHESAGLSCASSSGSLLQASPGTAR